jgi:hypothetical protein
MGTFNSQNNVPPLELCGFCSHKNSKVEEGWCKKHPSPPKGRCEDNSMLALANVKAMQILARGKGFVLYR